MRATALTTSGNKPSIWHEYDIDPVIGRLVAFVWKDTTGSIDIDAIRAIDAFPQRMQRRVVHSCILEIVIRFIVSAAAVSGCDIGCIGYNRNGSRKIQLLPATVSS